MAKSSAAKASKTKMDVTLNNTSFTKVFFNNVPEEDKSGWKPEDLNRIGKSMFDLAAERGKGKIKLRVFNPDLKKDGWHVPNTVIQIINDDMPFIIDSISAELARQSYVIDTLFHPILAVTRGGKNALETAISAKNGDEDSQAESMIYIQLDQLLSADAIKSLSQGLETVLADVRAATSDWKKMLAQVDAIMSEENRWEKAHSRADAHEAKEFVGYLKNNNFTFLGYRSYRFVKKKNETVAEVVENAGLGILKNKQAFLFGHDSVSAEIKAFSKSPWPVVVMKLADHPATVHRSVPMDAIAIKIVGDDGKIAGMHLFVGLFTSSTYSCRTVEVPIVRQKVQRTIENAGFIRGSHDAKALEHILEKMPRDELFQVSTEDLQTLSQGVLRLQTKNRIALFSHMDPLEQYMSCLVYVPRDRYNTKLRKAAAAVVEACVTGTVVNFFTTLDDSPFARMLFTIKLEGKREEAYDHNQLEAELQALGREWDERLIDVLAPVYGKAKSSALAQVYGRAFTSAYHESILIDNALHDIRQIEALTASQDKIAIDLFRLQETGELRLKVYHTGSPVALSDILPVLENMGLRSISEMPYKVNPQGFDKTVWLHDFLLESPEAIDVATVKANFEETFLQVWKGAVENDGLNALSVKAHLNWREILMLRAYGRFMLQARYPHSRVYVTQVLSSYPKITRALVDLFKALHDPKITGDRAKLANVAGETIDNLLQDVQKLDHDRILRNFRMMIEKTLRTNYFQTGADGTAKDVIAMKLDSKHIADLPLPRPHVEIFVYSSRVEAVHLRGGEIARGGIRWSDRHDDFRTEVLGLLKSQQVKNTVIVPVGAKGGFIVKQPPKTGGRDAYQAEGIECYKIFVQSLLDITDNNVKGKVIRPKDVVCHDGIDPYLVVAADKGTATFSDIANKLSLDAGFWLGDAFASGGATGYDHKKVAITARGGWESVKRHFREIGKDIQAEPFTVAGVGDMGGDVFGNAMLLSKQIKLVAAFNHVHIFLDPTPDTAKSFAERQRLFNTRGGWDAYDKSLISTGGGVFERSAKVIKLTPQVKKLLNLTVDQMTPDELMHSILKAEVELMWFGGIGTYVKSSRQSHADADDKANDSIRVDGNELRAQVVGEGANLGTTQLGRIEYARHGGRINTDFIDNSAGVDCSDHEVNIKILLNEVMANKKLTLPARNKLMEKMTDAVAKLVLTDNYQQSQSLSVQLARANDELALHAALIRDLEKSGLIKRSLEGLPDDESLARLARDNMGLTRPELCILTSYSKITIYNQILASNIPDDVAMEKLLFAYFPEELHKYEKEIRSHRLRREIIATQVVNLIVNRMGPVFVASRMAKTGKSAVDVIKAFMVVVDAYNISDMWQKIESLDNKVTAAAQTAALNEIFLVVKRAVTWFLRFSGNKLDVTEMIKAYGPGIEELSQTILGLVPDSIQANIQADKEQLTTAGLPPAVIDNISIMKLLVSANDIVSLSKKSRANVPVVAAIYYLIGEQFGFDWLRQSLSSLPVTNSWQARVRGGLMDDFYAYQAQITAIAVSKGSKSGQANGKMLNEWLDQYEDQLAQIRDLVSAVRTSAKIELDMLVLIGQRIGQLAQAMGI